MLLKGFKEFINESGSTATYQDLKLLLELGMVGDIADDVNQLIDQGKMTKEEIIDWVTPICDKYGIQDWSIDEEGLVNVDGEVDLFKRELVHIPLRFGKVTGFFWCNYNQLTTLEGAPKEVGGGFNCQNNDLTTLKGGPEKVGKNFICSYNHLTTLEGAPREVGGDFYCRWNKLTNLDGIGEVGGKIVSDLNN